MEKGTLVVSRRAGQTIEIGEDVSICVTRISGSQVTISVSAPKAVKVNRGEVAARLRNEQTEAPEPKISWRTNALLVAQG